jgi:hypothetical protein
MTRDLHLTAIYRKNVTGVASEQTQAAIFFHDSVAFADATGFALVWPQWRNEDG